MRSRGPAPFAAELLNEARLGRTVADPAGE
jgi:hypothetical protein